jgi:hypothetical protein
MYESKGHWSLAKHIGSQKSTEDVCSLPEDIESISEFYSGDKMKYRREGIRQPSPIRS